MKQEWLMPGAVVPVDMETTAALVAEIKRALNQRREWQGLTEDEINEVLGGDIRDEPSGELEFVRAIEAKLKEKNT